MFYLRVRVPDRLRLLLGITEVQRSLRTYAPVDARTLAAIYGARLFGVFDVLKRKDFSKEDARRLIAACFRDLAGEVDDGWIPSSDEPDQERDDQRRMSEENVQELEDQRSRAAFSHGVMALADDVLGASGLSLKGLSGGRRVDVLDGVTRALIEAQRLFRTRLDDRLSKYEPRDPLFRPAALPDAEATFTAHTKPQGIALGEAIDTYLDAKRSGWTQKTFVSRQRRLELLREHLGQDRCLREVMPEDIRSFRDAVRRLRRTVGRFRAASFKAKQTVNTADQIDPATAALIMVPCQAFFRWSMSEQGYIAVNPAANVRISTPKKVKGKKSRRPFTADELSILFSAPLFTGCLSPSRRFEAGQHLVKDARYWIPILGYYAGCRVGELVQLHLADVKLDGPIPYIDITEDGTGPTGGPDSKHVKSEAGVRKVPLHPDVIELGFAKFVADRRKGKLRGKRLFYEIGFGKDGQASTTFSKWFGRFMDKAGLSDPALVFHSFRHAAEDAFRNAGQQQYVIDRIIGHSDASTSAAYGDGISLEVAYGAVKVMKMPVSLPQLLKNLSVTP